MGGFEEFSPMTMQGLRILHYPAFGTLIPSSFNIQVNGYLMPLLLELLLVFLMSHSHIT